LSEQTLNQRHAEALYEEAGKYWSAVRTKARCEKKAATWCERCGIPYYLPLRRSVRRYEKRRAEFLVPLFTGYIFALIAPEEKTDLATSPHVAVVLLPDTMMAATLVRELNDVLVLERAVGEGELEVRPEIEVGKLVEIRGGPLAGVHGVVTQRRNRCRLTVNVEMVGQSVSLDVDADEVELQL